ncbi:MULTISPECIES: hypothetical protein [unclassified Oceanispirochaeta]|uniref:hypothetical protein n=1 Tax=unclassified Oceanispirochaeta TaxID=2635722 RepID=UPI000E096ECF|nr:MULTISPECIES: hypothetical protein [unclassified Oceanispirochaeta]MBF9014076.1 hypothetical protein [Oceanispirochaeta sp. M2]NPD70567.1 hypothetical protein [Oceanispirochaeta sp. M1]RDG34334.1 hypothetical protein DV872_00525 [Oceanispirochaeta sp. M1]
MSARKRGKKRTDTLALFLSPSFRFWTGLALIPAYFMIESLLVKALLVLLFSFTARLAGKKIRILYFVFLISSITFFHLLTPMGKILAEIGPFRITTGALETGIHKGLTLCGLVFLSLFSVTPALKLPGRVGGLLARMFYYFEEILDGKKKISPSNFIGSLDDVLMDLFPPERLGETAVTAEAEINRSLPLSFLYLFVMVGAVWGSLLLQILVL